MSDTVYTNEETISDQSGDTLLEQETEQGSLEEASTENQETPVGESSESVETALPEEEGEPVIPEWQLHPVMRREVDGSYVIQKGNYPYHVPKQGEWAALWEEINAWAAENPDALTVEPAPVPYVPTLEEVKAKAVSLVDRATSAAIVAGFSYAVEVEGSSETLHFSYDTFDQQNFADTANVATLALMGVEGLPSSVTWNAYRDWNQETGGELVRLTFDPSGFLALYNAGALTHKAVQMEIGGQHKMALETAETAEAVHDLLIDWGLSDA